MEHPYAMLVTKQHDFVSQPQVISTPKATEILILVKAIGVNRLDLEQREMEGFFGKTLGLEVSGIVLDIGKDVTSFHVGDKVMALISDGGYATHTCANAKLCFLIPDYMTFAEAAAIPEAYFTIYNNLFKKANLPQQKSILIHGGAGGLGTCAIQLSKLFNLQVFTTVSNSQKKESCESLGADHVILYHQQDFVQVIRQITKQKGVDIVVDFIGGNYVARNLEVLAFNGQLIQLDLQEGNLAGFNLWPILTKSLSLTGSLLRPLSLTEKSAIAIELSSKIMPLIRKKQLKPLIYTSLPLTKAREAHYLLENTLNIGKVILIP